MPGNLWAIILAGGNGERLLPLTRLFYGDDRPKQFADFDGRGSLLRRTERRVARVVPTQRTIIVGLRQHAPYFRGEFDHGRRVVLQPEGRGTASALAWPATWIQRNDPDAVVTVFPSDHHFRDEELLVSHLRQVVAAPTSLRMMLLGAHADGPETDYGWVSPGEPVAGELDSVYRVRSFVEKPSSTLALECYSRHDLWNTLMLVAPVATMVDALKQALPDHSRRAACSVAGAPCTSAMFGNAYVGLPSADLSRDVLQPLATELLVNRLPPVGWSDWGTPERVTRDLSGTSPAWPPPTRRESPAGRRRVAVRVPQAAAS